MISAINTRNIFVGLGALLLTCILFSIAGWLMLNFSQQGALIMAREAGAISDADFAEAFFSKTESMILATELIVGPLIALSVGCFVGLLARERVWLPTLLGLIPVFLFFLSVPSVRLGLLCGIYTSLAIAIATFLSRRRRKAFNNAS